MPKTYFGPMPSEIDKELVGPVKLLRSASKIDPVANTIKLPLYKGQMKDGRLVWFILTDTDDKPNADALGLNFSGKLSYMAVGPATLDQGTLAPAMADVPTGRDDSAFSPIERLFVIANGPMGANNPQRQGLNSAIHDRGPGGKPLPPIQVIGGVPTIALDYSPLWDLNLGAWTKQAVAKGYRSRLIDEFQYLDMVRKGWITGPKGKRFGSTGIVVNCPIVMRLL